MTAALPQPSASDERLFVLVGGWPASGKSTLARQLAGVLGLACLSKDEVKEALMETLGRPSSVPESRRLGVAAVTATLTMARSCPGAVIDSTWYPYSRGLVEQLSGRCVEVRCLVPRALAKERYAGRHRHAGHLDEQRDETELWARRVDPLGVGPLVEVDTSKPVNLEALADRINATRRDP